MPDIPRDTRDAVVRWIGHAVNSLPMAGPATAASMAARRRALQELARAADDLKDGPAATRDAMTVCAALEAAAAEIAGMPADGGAAPGQDPRAPVLKWIRQSFDALERYKDDPGQ